MNENNNNNNNVDTIPFETPTNGTVTQVQEQPVVNPVPVVETSTMSTPVTPSEPPKKKNTALIIVIIVVAVILLVAGIIVAINIFKPKGTVTPTNNTNTNTNTNTSVETKEEVKEVVYTFTTPLGTDYNIIKRTYDYKEILGVDLSRYQEKKINLGNVASVISYDEIKKLNLPDAYEKGIRHVASSVGCTTCEGKSKQGMINELNQYYATKGNTEAINYIIENCKINWKEQAVIRAYKNLSIGYSKNLIYRNLISSQFTEEEAQYALSQIEDIDYYEQAVHRALSAKYGEGKTDSEALRKYLADRDFTEEEINYALKIVFEEIK
jgi:SOS response regulatory protein OraA/RecX